MFIAFLESWLLCGIIIMGISNLIINVKLLEKLKKRENLKEFLIARFIQTIAILCDVILIFILNILQGESYWLSLTSFFSFLPLTITNGFSLRNNNQQNKK